MDRGNLDFVLSLDMLGFFKRHVLLYGLPPAKHGLIIDTSNTRDIKIIFEERPKNTEWEAIQGNKNFFEANGKEIISKAQFLELLDESSKPIDTEPLILMQKSHSLDFKIVQLMALIDEGALSYFDNKWPIIAANFEACKSSIYPIRCIQWIGENLLPKQTPQLVAMPENEAIPAPKFNWKASKTAAYQLIRGLKKEGIISGDSDWPQLAAVLKSAFSCFEDKGIDDIAKELRRDQFAKRNGEGHKIDKIIKNTKSNN